MVIATGYLINIFTDFCLFRKSLGYLPKYLTSLQVSVGTEDNDLDRESLDRLFYCMSAPFNRSQVTLNENEIQLIIHPEQVMEEDDPYVMTKILSEILKLFNQFYIWKPFVKNLKVQVMGNFPALGSLTLGPVVGTLPAVAQAQMFMRPLSLGEGSIGKLPTYLLTVDNCGRALMTTSSQGLIIETITEPGDARPLP